MTMACDTMSTFPTPLPASPLGLPEFVGVVGREGQRHVRGLLVLSREATDKTKTEECKAIRTQARSVSTTTPQIMRERERELERGGGGGCRTKSMPSYACHTASRRAIFQYAHTFACRTITFPFLPIPGHVIAWKTCHTAAIS